MSVFGQFFAFITVVAFVLLAIAVLNRPQGTQAAGQALFGGAHEILSLLQTNQGSAYPGVA